MSRVVRKKNPTHTCQQEQKIRFGNSDFVDLDRFSFYQASIELRSKSQ